MGGGGSGNLFHKVFIWCQQLKNNADIVKSIQRKNTRTANNTKTCLRAKHSSRNLRGDLIIVFMHLNTENKTLVMGSPV